MRAISYRFKSGHQHHPEALFIRVSGFFMPFFKVCFVAKNVLIYIEFRINMVTCNACKAFIYKALQDVSEKKAVTFYFTASNCLTLHSQNRPLNHHQSVCKYLMLFRYYCDRATSVYPSFLYRSCEEWLHMNGEDHENEYA